VSDVSRVWLTLQTCIYDEGHKLKNCATKAYTDLVSIKPKWRLLLTGTPLQNNLQELVVRRCHNESS
jgi:SWI/SNF-related matrix-associated actin-dependent regulator 1 of chromatin subfamily A